MLGVSLDHQILDHPAAVVQGRLRLRRSMTLINRGQH
jgi:hypothetical protein